MINIGDEVEIIKYKDFCPYTWTTVGSKGTVVALESLGEIRVAWYHFGNPMCRDKVGSRYSVEACYLKVISSAIKLSNADLKYDKIILKLKRMEAKRKELGYKTYGPL